MSEAVELVLTTQPHDIGAFEVKRALPKRERRHLGPFVFFDHMGPAELKPGAGMDVRPHPHIGLSTVTYLFDGEIMHRDSLGFVQAIRPGAVNWMTAGRGIVHSERTPDELRGGGMTIHGIQTWVALPPDMEEIEPAFEHHPADTLPRANVGGVLLVGILGNAFGLTAPVKVHSPIFYLHAEFTQGASLPMTREHAERGFYVVTGEIALGDARYAAGNLVVLREGAEATLAAPDGPARVMLLGGAKLPGERTIWWNFVSSDKARLERAKRDWKEGRFPKVPGEDEFIPLPD